MWEIALHRRGAEGAEGRRDDSKSSARLCVSAPLRLHTIPRFSDSVVPHGGMEDCVENMMIPLAEVPKLQNSQWVIYLRESERADYEMGGEPLTQEEMDILSESGPRTLPWKRR